MAGGCPPTKFKPDIVERILQDISDGIPYKISAESNAVSERALYDWIQSGVKDISEGIESDHAKFVQSLREIEKNRIKNNISSIRSSEKGHRGCEWELERSFWKYFSSHAQNIELNERVENLEKSKENK